MTQSYVESMLHMQGEMRRMLGLLLAALETPGDLNKADVANLIDDASHLLDRLPPDGWYESILGMMGMSKLKDGELTKMPQFLSAGHGFLVGRANNPGNMDGYVEVELYDSDHEGDIKATSKVVLPFCVRSDPTTEAPAPNTAVTMAHLRNAARVALEWAEGVLTLSGRKGTCVSVHFAETIKSVGDNKHPVVLATELAMEANPNLKL